MTKKTKKQKLITKAGILKLQKDLAYREKKLRKLIADKIDEAKKQGDLSENAAYTAALEEYQMNEAKIDELKKELSQVQIVDDSQDKSKVNIGDTVVVEDTQSGSNMTYKVGSENEIDPRRGTISYKSPIGIAIMNKKKNDIVIIKLPNGDKKFKILSIA